jgi:hypothetical protein
MMRNSIPCLGIIRIRCKGFDLSLSFNPQADKAPLLVSAAKIQLFLITYSKIFAFYVIPSRGYARMESIGGKNFVVVEIKHYELFAENPCWP